MRRRPATSSRCASRSTSSAAAARRRGARSSCARPSRRAAWRLGVPARANATDPAFAGTLLGVGKKRGAAAPQGARASVRARRADDAGLRRETPRAWAATSRCPSRRPRRSSARSTPITRTSRSISRRSRRPRSRTSTPKCGRSSPRPLRRSTTTGVVLGLPTRCSTRRRSRRFAKATRSKGRKGRVTFGAFDAIGDGRVDQGQAFDYNKETTENFFSANLQRVAVDTSYGLHDELNSFQGGISNLKTHFFAYGNVGVRARLLGGRAGTGGVPRIRSRLCQRDDRRRAQRAAGRRAVRSRRQLRSADRSDRLRVVRAQDDHFSPTYFLHDIQVQDFYARYHNRVGGLDQTDTAERTQFDFRNLITAKVNFSANGVQVADREFLPFDGNLLYLGYKVNTVTPTYVQHVYGKYYHGQLDAIHLPYHATIAQAAAPDARGRPGHVLHALSGRNERDAVARAREPRLADQQRRVVRRRRAPDLRTVFSRTRSRCRRSER